MNENEKTNDALETEQEVERTSPIRFVYKGNNYCLEFTKRTVKRMESEGFSSENARNGNLMTFFTTLWNGAFYAHHPYVTPELKEEILSNMGNKEQLFPALADLYSLPLKGLLAEPDEGNTISWE